MNIGCGKNPIQGWINLDVVSHQGVYFWDCRSGLPFSDAAVAAIYSEHFFEHLDAETEAARIPSRMSALSAVLKVSCVWSCRTQGTYLRAYSGPWEVLAEMRPLDSHRRRMARQMEAPGEIYQPIGRSTAEH